jgi:hypothetical protein
MDTVTTCEIENMNIEMGVGDEVEYDEETEDRSQINVPVSVVGTLGANMNLIFMLCSCLNCYPDSVPLIAQVTDFEIEKAIRSGEK